MAVEEVLAQIKGLEDEADVFLVLAGDGNERVETDADLRAGRLDDAEVVQAAGGCNQARHASGKKVAILLHLRHNPSASLMHARSAEKSSK